MFENPMPEYIKVYRDLLRGYSYVENSPGVFERPKAYWILWWRTVSDKDKKVIYVPFSPPEGHYEETLIDIANNTDPYLHKDTVEELFFRAMSNKVLFLFKTTQETADITPHIAQLFETLLPPSERDKIHRIATTAENYIKYRQPCYWGKEERPWESSHKHVVYQHPINTNPKDLLCLFAQRFFKTLYQALKDVENPELTNKNTRLWHFKRALEFLEENHGLVAITTSPAENLAKLLYEAQEEAQEEEEKSWGYAMYG